MLFHMFVYLLVSVLFDADAISTKDAPTDRATHGLGLGGRLAGSYVIHVTRT